MSKNANHVFRILGRNYDKRAVYNKSVSNDPFYWILTGIENVSAFSFPLIDSNRCQSLPFN